MGVPAPLRLPLCIAGIWTCFFGYGILQEGISKYRSADNSKFSQVMLLLIIEHAGSALLALLVIVLFGQGSGNSWKQFFKPQGIIAAAQCGAKFSSNEALKSVSYPIQALAKSSKTLPAMVGALISGKVITKIQWVAALGITGGVAMFSMAGKKSKDGKTAIDASAFGIFLLVVSLCCDGAVSMGQQGMRTLKDKLTPYEQMFMTNFGAALLLVPFAAFTGQLSSGTAFLMANPAIFKNIGSFSLCSAFGQVFIFLTINWFGPDTSAKITTLRKMGTVLISIVWFGHPMSREQWIAVGIVFTAVLSELAEQLLKKKDHKKTDGDKKEAKKEK